MIKELQRYFNFLLVIAICLSVTFTFNRVYAQESPEMVVKRLVNQVLDVLKDPKLKAEDKRAEKRAKLRALVQELFNLDDISKRVLGRYVRKFNKKQFEEFKTLFSRLLESVYLTRIENYSGEKVIFEAQRMLSANKASVLTKIIKNDTEIPVEYRLVKKNGKWTGYDVVIEGVSLVKNYRSQFYQVLKNKSVDDLLSMMKEKVNKLSSKGSTSKKS